MKTANLPLAIFMCAAALHGVDGLIYYVQYSMSADNFDWVRFSATIISRVSIVAFMLYFCFLTLVRADPVASAPGLLSKVTAILGACLPYSLLWLTPTDAGRWPAIMAALMSIAGMAGAIYTLRYLGRSVAMFAEARCLVIGGPYRWTPHPLYLFEELVTLSMLFWYQSLTAVLIVAVHWMMQMIRMRNEEKLLGETFPNEYHAYLSRLWYRNQH